MKKRDTTVREAILRAVAEYPGSFGIKSLFRHLGLSQRDYTEFRRVLHQLFDSGELDRRGKRRLYIRRREVIIEGVLRLTAHGYGFMDRGNESSVFISAREARRACDGDRISVSIFDSGHEAGPEGRILEVDESNRLPLLGRLTYSDGDWVAELKSGPLAFHAKVDPGKNRRELTRGDWALFALPGTRRRSPLPSCKIVSVLGAPTEKGVAEKGLLASYGLEGEYPSGAVREAVNLKAKSSRGGVREDLCGEFVVTIDPADAKDHDDAVSLRRDSQGDYLLGVHIADVSRYVPEGSQIDKEARRRSFSVYLQHHHLPMLPPKLPGDLCSLKPGKDRLALSVLLNIDQEGKILSRRIVPSRVRIGRLISYETAQQHIEKDEFGTKRGKIDPQLQSQLRQMWRLARVLQKRRLTEGGVNFDLPEPGFRWAEHAAPREIFRQPRLQSHQLIEEFMLAANRAVAEIWAEKWGDDMPQLFRVHPPPDAEKRQKLSDYLADAGVEWPADELITAQRINTLLDEIRRRFPAEVLSVVARKALMLARYDTRARGHFGLGFKRYLHFTSPIRRYADLTVHRLIWRYLIENRKMDAKEVLKEKLDQLCEAISVRERLIAEVEREAGKLAGLLYLQEHRDEAYPARFVEAAKERSFVSLENLFIEGALDEGSKIGFRPRGKKSSRYADKRDDYSRFSIGDALTVTPSRIDLLNRSLELIPV